MLVYRLHPCVLCGAGVPYCDFCVTATRLPVSPSPTACCPSQLKRQVLLSAAEAAEMVLRVDDIVKCAPRKRQEDHGH